MEFFKIRKDIPFMRHALVFNVISLVTFLLAVFFLATRGLNFGVDFTGGTVMEVSYPQAADLPKVRSLLERSGYTDVTVQNFGGSRDVLIRLPRTEFVGPQVGRELYENGGLALLFVSICIVMYLWFRFEWKFGVAAIIANLRS